MPLIGILMVFKTGGLEKKYNSSVVLKQMFLRSLNLELAPLQKNKIIR